MGGQKTKESLAEQAKFIHCNGQDFVSCNFSCKLWKQKAVWQHECPWKHPVSRCLLESAVFEAVCESCRPSKKAAGDLLLVSHPAVFSREAAPSRRRGTQSIYQPEPTAPLHQPASQQQQSLSENFLSDARSSLTTSHGEVPWRRTTFEGYGDTPPRQWWHFRCARQW